MSDSGEMSDTSSVGNNTYSSISSYYSTQGDHELTITVLGEVCIYLYIYVVYGFVIVTKLWQCCYIIMIVTVLLKQSCNK